MLSPNREQLEAVAMQLGPLLEEVVFVGGQVTELLISDPAAQHVRYTEDVDVVCRVTTHTAYYDFCDRLRDFGFSEDMSEGAPLCRWRTGVNILDVMPTEEKILGFSSPWYERAYETAKLYRLTQDLSIKVAHAPVFLACKCSAFENRGRGDYLASRDFEDIIMW